MRWNEWLEKTLHGEGSLVWQRNLRAALRTFLSCQSYLAQAKNVAVLEERVERLEQYHCEHEFSKKSKGCLESIFCSKCGALSPKWEAVPHTAMCYPDGDLNRGYAIYGGALEPPCKDDCVKVEGVWYRPKKKGKK